MADIAKKFECDEIQVALAADQRYFPGLLVTAVTIAAYAQPKCRLQFHILDGGIYDSDFENLERLILMNHPAARMNRVRVEAECFSGYRTYHGSLMTYARLMLPRLLGDCDFVIYCDVDFVWLADIAELWALRNENLYCQGVRDMDEENLSAVHGDVEYLRRAGYGVTNETYICAGLELLNLRKMRSDEIDSKMLTFLNDHPDNLLNDQSAINAVAYERIGILDPRWMTFCWKLRGGQVNGRVIHFANYGNVLFGVKKPDKFFVADDAIILWNRIYKRLTGRAIWSYAWNRLWFWLLIGLQAMGVARLVRVPALCKCRARFRQPSLKGLKR